MAVSYTHLLRLLHGYRRRTGRNYLRCTEAVRYLRNLKGKAAHAGIAPEEGVNAIMLAADALSKMLCLDQCSLHTSSISHLSFSQAQGWLAIWDGIPL